MEQKLSKHQIRILIALAQQKQEAKKAFDEITEAEREQLLMIVKYNNLPEGNYGLKQVGEDVILFSEESVLEPPVVTPPVDEEKKGE